MNIKIILWTCLLIHLTNAFIKDELKSIKKTFYFGVALNSTQLAHKEYQNATLYYTNTIIPKNACSMKYILTSNDTFDFKLCDEYLNYAYRHGYHMRGNALFSSDHVPAFFLRYRHSQKIHFIKHFLTKVLGYYRDHKRNIPMEDGRKLILSWDLVEKVVEPKTPGHYVPKLGLKRIGWNSAWFVSNLKPKKQNPWLDYIEMIYKEASEIDPSVYYFYSDDNVPKYRRYESIDFHTVNLFRFLDIFTSNVIPLDGVALQLQVTDKYFPTQSDIIQYCKDMKSRKLTVHITSLDYVGKILDKQASIYQGILGGCLMSPNCEMLTVSGWTDRDVSSRPDKDLNKDIYPYLLDELLQPKRVLNAVVEKIRDFSQSEVQPPKRRKPFIKSDSSTWGRRYLHSKGRNGYKARQNTYRDLYQYRQGYEEE